MSHPAARLDEWLASVLRGEPISDAWQSAGVDAVFEAAVGHDIVPLIADKLAAGTAIDSALQRRFREASQRSAATDLAVEVELKRLLTACAAAGVDALLIKGSHLAYTHYDRSDLRSRVDSDLIIDRAQRDATIGVLESLGYHADAKMSGELTATQQLFVLRRHDAAIHLVDLHWRLASPQVFAHVLSFDELRATSQPIPRLSSVARGPSNLHALLIACMHRVAHHHDEAERLKWIMDIHVIASRLRVDEWSQFMTLAVSREVVAVCRDGLEQSAAWLQTPVPAAVREHPAWSRASAETTADYLAPRTQASIVMADLRSLPGWSDRCRLVTEHLFPGATYMRRIYAPGSTLPLPMLYAWRIVKGARQWLTRTSPND